MAGRKTVLACAMAAAVVSQGDAFMHTSDGGDDDDYGEMDDRDMMILETMDDIKMMMVSREMVLNLVLFPHFVDEDERVRENQK
eukprot:752906-Hanusia_phi.AAC.8